MSREESILRAALRSGLTFELPPTKLFEFAELIAAAEREACANVCEILAWNQDSTWKAATMDCAAAIRSRGQE